MRTKCRSRGRGTGVNREPRKHSGFAPASCFPSSTRGFDSLYPLSISQISQFIRHKRFTRESARKISRKSARFGNFKKFKNEQENQENALFRTRGVRIERDEDHEDELLASCIRSPFAAR